MPGSTFPFPLWEKFLGPLGRLHSKTTFSHSDFLSTLYLVVCCYLPYHSEELCSRICRSLGAFISPKNRLLTLLFL
jgi:hypothetical protein